MLQPFITSVDIGLALGFVGTLAGSVWFCLNNYRADSENN